MKKLSRLLIFLSVCTAAPGGALAQRPTAPTAAGGAPGVVLAEKGRTGYSIALEGAPSETERFAASELARYLGQLSGATFRVAAGAGDRRAIVLRADSAVGARLGSPDAYTIAVRGDSVVLEGASDRAVLYAVYDFLGRLGCQWLAPDFEFYRGAAEVVPRRAELVYRAAGEVVEKPAFAIRTLDVAQAASQDTATLRRVIAWMPKVRFNTMRFPLDHGGTGRTRWDNWRDALTPDLERRGITIEVGGHGYQNFLSAKMEGGALFERHPEWFGKDEACQPSRATNLVFNTANPDAVSYLLDNAVRYLKAHPEIDVFDFWPPDGGRWATCKELEALGTPQDRQVKLVDQLHARLSEVRPGLGMEMIAYADALLPPETVSVPADVLVEFCPIDQSFDGQIDDPSIENNARYVAALRAWRRAFPGRIGIYTYYRKYAWRSLPNVIPHYIRRDLEWYASVPVQGVATYGEPADWFTYELNILATAAAAWNPDVNVDSLVDRYVRARFGAGRDAAREAYATLEAEYRPRGSIPFSAPDTPRELATARAALAVRRDAVGVARGTARDSAAAASLDRLGLMLDFAMRDLTIQEARVRGATPEQVGSMVRGLVDFLHANEGRGVFLTRSDDTVRYTKHYTRESRIAPDSAARPDPAATTPVPAPRAEGARVASPVVTLASDGVTEYTIARGAAPSATRAFAASELAVYLERMTGAAFPVAEKAGARAIVLRADSALGARLGSPDGYTIAVSGDSVLLTGASDRAVLYAVYDFLGRLGCRWLAPDLAFYQGAAEHVPSVATLRYDGTEEVTEHPVFAVRKLDVEEGLSHDSTSLARIVAWMPKARYNTLQVPLDYGGGGRVRWDNWRDALTPALKLRGIDIEVGGHGYQNFLNAEMEGGKLFELHPEWFGKDEQCRPSRAENLVFNTANPDAVAYLIANVVRYVRAHPEIDILDFWPPDGARWAECKELESLGTPQDRQARLVNQVSAALRRVRPGLRLEMIAYANAKLPPETEKIDPAVLVDFCPIGQNFDVPIDDPAGSNNAQYVDAIRAWRRDFGGEIGLYSYYRKYAWRSLPVQIPHYMQRDMRWYASVPLQGISTYSEPADWYSYELNHYTLSRLAWNPEVDVDSLIADYARVRYGPASGAAEAALAVLEDEFRLRGSIPYSAEDTPDQIATARAALAARATDLRSARERIGVGAPAEAQRENAGRLLLMLGFADRDLQLREAAARGATPAERAPLVRELVDFLTTNGDRGVFLTRSGDLTRYMKMYGAEG